MGANKYWILWLLLWQVASCSAKDLRCGPAMADVAVGSASKAAKLALNDRHMASDHHDALEPSLHSYIYNGDFIGFSKYLRVLSQHENFPSLLGALQGGDDRGMTIAHLLACAGRQQELSQLLDILFRMQGEGVEMIRRVVLESRNQDACKGKKCDLLADRPGLYAHGTLQFPHPPQQVVLFGDVTPLECAAAHGHVQTMKILIQGGVSPGKAFEVAKVFSLTNQLHQAIQLANTEGFLAQPKVFMPPPCSSQRQPRTKRHQSVPGCNSAQPASKDKCSNQQGTSRDSKALASQHFSSVELKAIAGSGSHASNSKSVGDSAKSEGSSTPKPKFSDMLDIAALLLLTGMLLLPLWSTVCLLWQRAVRRRAAVTEPARRIKQAMIAATTGTVSRANSITSSSSSSSTTEGCTGAATSSGSAAASSSKKSKAGAGSTVRQRKGQPLQVNAAVSGSGAGTSAKTVANIPVTVSYDEGETYDTDQTSVTLTRSSSSSSSVQAPLTVNTSSADRQTPMATSAGSGTSDTAAAAVSNRTASTPGKQKRGKDQGPGSSCSTAARVQAGTTASLATAGLTARSNSNASTSSSSLSGPATPADSVMDIFASATAASSNSSTAADAADTSKSLLQAAVAAAAETSAAGTLSAPVPSTSSNSKRRVAGSRSAVGTVAAPASSSAGGSFTGNVTGAKQQASTNSINSSSNQRNAKGKKGSKASSSALDCSASSSTAAAICSPQRTVSAGPALGEYSPIVVAVPELRALSAEDAAQTAKAYAALIAPYTPSAAAAAARPAIYQPPGMQAGTGTVTSSQQKLGTDLEPDTDDVKAHQRDQSKGGMDPAAAEGACAAAMHMPADTVELGSAAAAGGPTGQPVSSCSSGPAPLASANSTGSTASTSSSASRSIPIQRQSSAAYTLQPTNSGSIRDTGLSPVGAAAQGNVMRKLSDAASVHSDASFSSIGSPSSPWAQPPPPPPRPPAVSLAAAAAAAAGLSSSRSGTLSPCDEGLVSPPSSGAAAVAGASPGQCSAAAGEPYQPLRSSPGVARTLSVPLPVAWDSSTVPAMHSGQLDRSSSAAAMSGAALAADQQETAEGQVTAAQNAAEATAVAEPAAPDEANSSSSSLPAAAPPAADPSGVLGAGDMEVAGPGRSSSAGSFQAGLASPVGVPVTAQQQMLQPLSPNMQALASQLLQRPVHGTPDGSMQSVSPHMIAQIANRWQQLQQQQAAMRAQQQQQWVVASMGQAAMPQQQQQQGQQAVQLVLQPPASAANPAAAGPSGSVVHLPAGMVALMQASKSQAALLQQQQQQQQQQKPRQKLMVFVPQHSGVQMVSPSNGSFTTPSPQQRAVLLSPGSGVPALSLMQQHQQQQGAGVASAPFNQQAVYLQQQQQHQQLQPVQVMQLHGALQGGPLRVFSPSSNLQVPPGPLAAAGAVAVGHASHNGHNPSGSNAQIIMSPPGPGTASIAGQRLSVSGGAVGPLSPPGLHMPALPVSSPSPAGMSAAAFAALTSNAAATAQRTSSSGLSASQQLLAMVPGLQHGRLQQGQPPRPGQTMVNAPVNAKFDWSTLASDLAGGPVSPASAGAHAGGMPGYVGPLPVGLDAAPPGLIGTGVSASAEGNLSRSSAPPGGVEHNESARMAAELDELLHQANQQLGWSGIPRASDGGPADSTNKHLSTPPGSSGPVSTGGAPASTSSNLKPDAPEYQPKGSAASTAANPAAVSPACSAAGEAGGEATAGDVDADKSVHLKSLEALQLPDGFCSGD